MEDKINAIKSWLGTGSINIFGLPMSGKDTQGIKLAEALGAKFLSSGIIIRAMEKETNQNLSDSGALIPTNLFYEWVLPYFERPDLFRFPLVLSSIGRWSGEEDEVMNIAAGAGHDIKAVLYLKLTETEVKNRFEVAKSLGDRGERNDDKNPEIFATRLKEFHDKTLPVLETYRLLNLLIEINGNQTREAVFNEIVEKLYLLASKSHA